MHRFEKLTSISMATGSATGVRTLGTMSEDGDIRNGMQMACDLDAAPLMVVFLCNKANSSPLPWMNLCTPGLAVG